VSQKNRSTDESPTGSYDVFLSYANDPDYRLARDLEAYVESFHRIRSVQTLGVKKIEVCRDGSDFRIPRASIGELGSEVRSFLDFYLERSTYLAVLCSRGAVRSEYVNYEIAWFLQRGRADRVLLLVTEGDDPLGHPQQVFPKPILDAGLHRQIWYDLRGYRWFKNRAARRVRQFEDERARFIAELHDAPAGIIYPTWQRERARKQRLRRYAAALVTLVALSGLGRWAWTQTNTHQATQLLAEAVESTTESGAAELAAILVQIGEYEPAISLAHRIGSREEQIRTLCSMGTALLDVDDDVRAATVLRQALALRERTSESTQELDFRCLAGAIAALHDDPIVVRAVDSVEDATRRLAAERLVEMGESEAGLLLARRGTSPDWNTFSTLVRKLPQSRRQAAILTVLNGMSSPPEGAIRGLADVADDAVIHKLDPSRLTPTAACELLEWRARKGYEQGVRDIAQRGQCELRTAIRILLEANQARTALSLMRGVTSIGPDVTDAWVLIGEYFSSRGECDQVLEALRSAASSCRSDVECPGLHETKRKLSRECASARAWRGRSAQPDVTTHGQSAEGQAVASAKSGDIDGALKHAAVAIELARAQGDNLLTPPNRKSLPLMIAEALPNRLIARAFDVFVRLGVEDCSPLVPVLGRTGDIELTSRAVRECATDATREGVLFNAIEALIEAKRVDHVSELVGAPGARKHEPLTVAATVYAMAIAGRGDQVLRWGEELTGARRALTLAAAAALMAPSSPSVREIAEQAVQTPTSDDDVEVRQIHYKVGRNLVVAGQMDLVLEVSNRTRDERETSDLRAAAALASADQGSIRRSREIINTIPNRAWKESATRAVLRRWFNLPGRFDFPADQPSDEKRIYRYYNPEFLLDSGGVRSVQSTPP
jgi:tetratricopeptide (TPR) repeat protein